MLSHIIGKAHKHIAYRISRAKKELGYDPRINCCKGYKTAIEKCFAKGLLKKQKTKQTRKAVFLDRDGVLVKEMIRDGKCYTPLSLEEMEITPGIRKAAKTLRDHGFLIFVVTNQPDIARKRLDPAILCRMHARLREVMGGESIVKEIYVCPHDHEKGCDCRKPKPGMLLRAASEWGLDLGRSFFIGDHARDVGAGRAAGCKTVLIRKDYNKGVEADEIASDLEDAVRQVITAAKKV